MLKKAVICLFALAAAVSLTACQSSADKNQTDTTNSAVQTPYYSFYDDTDTEVILTEKPQKVAVLFSSFADVWQTAGGQVDITVGESVERGFADEEARLVDDGAGKTINNELLLSYQPDFVICSADLEEQVKTAEFLRKNGIAAAVFHVESFDDYLHMLQICTDITQKPDNYETYGAAVQKQIQDLLSATSTTNGEAPLRILFVRAGSKYSATKAKTAENNFVCVMLKELGTYNIAENAPILLDGLSLEEIVTENPDYIFISTMGDEAAAKAYMDSVLQQDAWQHLDAVRAGRYAYLPKDLFQFKPNKRWGEAYQYLADLLYPKEQ